jgi:uncharacterized damage-inducible protein DinB
MENAVSIIEDLFLFNQWAQGRLLSLCDGLTDIQLDQPREMGFGSLRNTIFHILTAEQVWMERWQSVPWRPFPTDAQGMTLGEMEQNLNSLFHQRQKLIEAESINGWSRVINYRDSRGNDYSQPLRPLLLHVANHGTHHRAQALNYLKNYGRTVPVGLDYLMYKLARPTIEQTPTSVHSLKQHGLEIATAPGRNVHWDKELVQMYFDYHDWATDQILVALEHANDEVWDKSFAMGIGSIRRTLTHLLDAELWWRDHWLGQSKPWKDSGRLTWIQLREQWQTIRSERRNLIESLDENSCQRVVQVTVGGPPILIRIVESLVQLCTHGTHHRAQLVNMLRHNQIKPPAIDVMVWCR